MQNKAGLYRIERTVQDKAVLWTVQDKAELYRVVDCAG